MSKLLLSALLTAGVLSTAAAEKGEKGDKVEYKTYTSPYFEKNTSGLKGDASFLVLPDKKSFDAIFGVGFVMGKKPDTLTAADFDKKLVAGVIKRGNAIVTYKVTGVTSADGVLTVTYTTKAGEPGTATFASPLIVAVDKGKYKSVAFLENGKKVGTFEIEK